MSQQSAYGTPLSISSDEKVECLKRLPLSGDSGGYDESQIQELVFAHPELIPIDQIDQSYRDLIPVCKEMKCGAGYMDVLMVTPEGKLCIIETKLWNNPEARRKVVGQILDYAGELARWKYEDLQRQVSRATERPGNEPFRIVKEKFPSVNEKDFIDGVYQSLATGEFLLLIIGDGIREGTHAISEYIGNSGNLHFTLGLVEFQLFRNKRNDILVLPRVLAKTAIINRSIFNISLDGQLVQVEPESRGQLELEEELQPQQKLLFEFWSELRDRLILDDPSQPLNSPGKGTNYYLYLPPSKNQAWISAYIAKSSNRIGVYIRIKNDDFGRIAYSEFLAEKEVILGEAAIMLDWTEEEEGYYVTCKQQYEDLHDRENRDRALEFFAEYLNVFVNIFRPRLAKLASQD